MGRKWLYIGACAAVCAVGAVGLFLALSPPKAPPPEPPNLVIDVKVVPQVMTSVYKLYSTGDQLFATTTITNKGKDPVKNFQIGYDIPGYIASSGEENYDTILPGQTIVDWCYPTFPTKKMKEINSPVGVELHVGYTYDGSNGEKSTSAQTELLSHHDMVWTTLPEEQVIDWYDSYNNGYMLAAFVTKDDPKVQKVAKYWTKGIATYTDKGALTAAEQLFNGLYWDGIDYVSEPGTYWESHAQSVQYPADTIDNGGGNCVDLSVLFAACLEAVGVKTSLCLLDQHCMVMLTLPESGEQYVLEETVVGKANWSFNEALNAGYRTYKQNYNNGTWLEYDVQEQWASGVVPSW